ncbi:MAG: type IV secretion system DNA-binding domain-containing protein [Mycoplasmataceae bacterium]|nr:type IV secretion system DNA-binding domain-containing protein [Mycoplasmataceae bacterium]
MNGKGDIGLFNDLKILTKNNNYVLKCWSPKFDLEKNERFVYNPFADKDVNSVTSMLMEIGRYSLLEETTPGAIYYKDNEMACINLITKILIYKQNNHSRNDKTDYTITLDNLFEFAALEKIQEVLEVNKYFRKNEKSELEKRFNFYVNLKDKIKKAVLDNTIATKFSIFREEAWNAVDDNASKPIPDAWCNNLQNLNIQIDKMFNGIKYARQNLKKLSEDEIVNEMQNQELKRLFQDYLDVAKDDDKSKALRQIKTTFRNLRNINSLTAPVISGHGTTLKSFIQSDEPTILLMSLDTTSLKTQSNQVARMLIADLKQNLPSVRVKNPGNNLLCIFDEFGSFATQDIAELHEQGRSFGFQTVYAIQTLSNLTQVGENFAARIVGNCNTYIIHRLREDKGAESIANIIGTNPAFEFTERQSDGVATGEKSIREVQQYIFHPREIRQLDDHHALITTIADGKLVPLKGAIKIDFADIQNFYSEPSLKSNIKKSINHVKDARLIFTPKQIPD